MRATRARERCALLALAAVCGLAALMVAAAPVPQPLVAAHRGGALLWPENSLTAFRQALALGVDYLETDVHLTADGEVVVLHDPTLDRTTTGSGRVRAARLADLSSVRLRDRSGGVTQDAVPTLGQLLDLLAPSAAQLLLEIKVDADRQRYPGIEEKVAGPGERPRARRSHGDHGLRGRDHPAHSGPPAVHPDGVPGRQGAPGSRGGAGAREPCGGRGSSGATQLGIDHRVLDPGRRGGRAGRRHRGGGLDRQRGARSAQPSSRPG